VAATTKWENTGRQCQFLDGSYPDQHGCARRWSGEICDDGAGYGDDEPPAVSPLYYAGDTNFMDIEAAISGWRRPESRRLRGLQRSTFADKVAEVNDGAMASLFVQVTR